jgi:hypothetical protein
VTTLAPVRVPGAWRDFAVVATAVIVAAALAVATVAVGREPPVALAALAMFVLVATRPVVGAYAYLVLLPFVAGIERGLVLPNMRPSEVLQAYLTAAVLGGVYVRVLRGDALRVQVTRLDRAIIALATFASVWPLLWLFVRGNDPTKSDFLSTMAFWRLVALYALFRYVVRTPEHVRRCMWILLAGASGLAVVAALQALGLPTITAILDADGGGRGGATLSSAIAVGDYLAYSLAVVLALYLRQAAPRRVLGAIAVVLVIGSVGTGQFSAWIGASIVLVAIAAHERQLARMAFRVLPVVVIGLLVAWPVVDRRLEGFGGEAGYPTSWLGRIDNLTSFFLPRLGDFQWVLGVRPDPVLPAPETWRQVIYLESGILWLLWVGGIPLLLAFCWFLGTAFRHTHTLARSRSDVVGVASLAAFGSLCALTLLTIFDPHLQFRGGGDVLFILLALSANRFVTDSGQTDARQDSGPLDRPEGVRW